MPLPAAAGAQRTDDRHTTGNTRPASRDTVDCGHHIAEKAPAELAALLAGLSPKAPFPLFLA
jgi:hypothetical protein